MPKTNEQFDPALYAPVADRITLFWAAFPLGRIETRLVRRTASDVVFLARVYRTGEDRRAAATGWAAEREGDGDVNTVACLENAETSAIGRALANLGFTAARARPSAEEMAKSERIRRRVAEPAPERYRVNEDPRQIRANIIHDLVRMIGAAERAGLRPIRAERWRRFILTTPVDPARLNVWEARLRDWIHARRTSEGASMSRVGVFQVDRTDAVAGAGSRLSHGR
jgi:hypothetical protein